MNLFVNKSQTYTERFREIVSDPLNILIERDPESGFVDGDHIILHNGNRVTRHGYYQHFSDILIINRGVHEPLEEYCFQQLLKKITQKTPVMIELGAYWAHYSMWLIKKFPTATCIMIEPEEEYLNVGKENFRINNYQGEFIQAAIGENLKLDNFFCSRAIDQIDILHSDIQSYEMEMLLNAKDFLSEQKASYVFLSTHNEQLHNDCVQKLKDYNYRIEVSSGHDWHTTSYDGFIMASSYQVEPVFENFSPLGRIDIALSDNKKILKYLINNFLL